MLFLSGALVACYAVIALFFAKFWRRSGDRLFLLFAAAFAILTVQRTMLAFAVHTEQTTTWLYALRLLAFLVILAAIVDKNRGPKERAARER